MLLEHDFAAQSPNRSRNFCYEFWLLGYLMPPVILYQGRILILADLMQLERMLVNKVFPPDYMERGNGYPALKIFLRNEVSIPTDHERRKAVQDYCAFEWWSLVWVAR